MKTINECINRLILVENTEDCKRFFKILDDNGYHYKGDRRSLKKEDFNIINALIFTINENKELIVLKRKESISDKDELSILINCKDIKDSTKETSTPSYYNNDKGSLYLFAEQHNLNAWEFDIIKRITRCRKKGNFKKDLYKTKVVIDLYLKEFNN